MPALRAAHDCLHAVCCRGATQRLSKVQEVLSVMLGPGGAAAGQAAGKGNDGGAGGGGGGGALRTCMGVVVEMSKEVDAFKKEAFENWQVSLSSHKRTQGAAIWRQTPSPLAAPQLTQDATADAMADMASWKNSKLMTFDSQNLHVKTHFNDQLVVLLREVRVWRVGWRADVQGAGAGSLACAAEATRSSSTTLPAAHAGGVLHSLASHRRLGIAERGLA